MIKEANKVLSETSLETASSLRKNFFPFPSAWLDHITQVSLHVSINILVTMFSTMGTSLLPDKTRTTSQTPSAKLFSCLVQAGTLRTLEGLEITSWRQLHTTGLGPWMTRWRRLSQPAAPNPDWYISKK